jgi:capsid protein
MSENPTTTPARLSDRVGSVHVPLVRRATVRGRYDNAETTDENRRHWANVSDLAPDALGNAHVRRRLRNRCRYECRNNSWAKGVRDTLANDTVGTGPRLQMHIADNPELNGLIETDFSDWAEEVGLAEKLRIMRSGRVESGEIFGLLANNPGLVSAVKLDLRLAEAEQVTTPDVLDRQITLTDGIEYDPYGNPTTYWVLRHHPGVLSLAYFTMMADFDPWPAKYVLHYYRPDRPGQSRGVPDLTPAIDQFAELRRFSKAVIAAAEAVADHALVIYSEAPPDPDSAEESTVEAMDTVELTRRMATTLPQGWKLGQVQAEQPTTTYKEFVNAKLAEIARCLGVPLFVAGLDAADANMSAAYVVGQKYERTITVDRAELECLLNRLLDVWLTEWLLVNRPANVPARFDRVWQWDEIGNHADPVKVATARATELAAGTTNIPREYAKKGLDWEAEQNAAAKSLGLSLDEYRRMLRDKIFNAGTGGQQQQPDPSNQQDNNEPADQ